MEKINTDYKQSTWKNLEWNFQDTKTAILTLKIYNEHHLLFIWDSPPP